MVRAPCCEKMGLKRGPWTPEEDQILVSYINRFGHGNWRALPKLAGLLRCGKSCRLRWTNYLRPDIKRGNFSREEEDIIINLHETLGNRWSAIAARLPGRTDNEIKNVWHTHLKKRINNSNNSPSAVQESKPKKARPEIAHNPGPVSPVRSCSEISSSVSGAASCSNSGSREDCMDSFEGFPEIDESFWSDALHLDQDGFNSTTTCMSEPLDSLDALSGDDMGFWLKVFMESGESLELPDI